MKLEEALDEAGKVNRRLLHRVVAGILYESELGTRKPLPERLPQVLLLEPRKILTAADPRSGVPTSASRTSAEKSVSSHIR